MCLVLKYFYPKVRHCFSQGRSHLMGIGAWAPQLFCLVEDKSRFLALPPAMFWKIGSKNLGSCAILLTKI